MPDGVGFLYTENEHHALVDALPYIDTQLGQTEVEAQVKAMIQEEMRHFEPRDYLASLPAPEVTALESKVLSEEFARMDAGLPMTGVDSERYFIRRPEGPAEGDPTAWKSAAERTQVQLEYNRLRLTNLELLERWGTKAWVASFGLMRVNEQAASNDAAAAREAREEVNKKRKLDQISCGNELRKLGRELEQYLQDNSEVQRGLQELEVEVARLRRTARERGIFVEQDLHNVAIGENDRHERVTATDAAKPSDEGTSKGGKKQEKDGEETAVVGEKRKVQDASPGASEKNIDK